jgi:prepilin-type N-terminal cleavage/methylation domain-containing protein
MRKFTLIELLVVVAIIGILASLLLPSLHKAREKAKTAVCISNVRQINTALQTYFVDNKDLLPYDGNIHDTWPSFLDPLLGNTEFQGPTGTTRPDMSKIWSTCPNAKNDLREPVYFRDADYAGVFPSSLNWPRSLSFVSDPSSSVVFTEGNHEAGAQDLGNSWIRVGNGAGEAEYNKITGFSWGRVRHEFQKKFVISNFDCSSKAISWKNLNTFSNDHAVWVNEY